MLARYKCNCSEPAHHQLAVVMVESSLQKLIQVIKGLSKMAGHSKWANIQHRKGRQDAKRGKIFTKIIKEITVAARLGGGDTAMNPRLRAAVAEAKEENMPSDNIMRAIKKGTGELEGVNYEEIRYEGYGINGAAIIIDCLTDNKQRAVMEVRHALTKNGGNLGTDGSVVFMFKHCGQLVFEPGASEEAIMEVALEAGAEDIVTDEDGSVEVLTAPSDFLAVKEALEAAGLKPVMSEVTMKPESEVAFTGDDAIKMQKILDTLEDLDDVQDVYTTAIIED
jgi:YebC/PmpR family DNA-binding regulatory protein